MERITSDSEVRRPTTPDANPRSEFFNSIEGSGESGSGPTLALAYAVVSRVLNARGVYSDALLSAQEASRLDPANGNYFDDEAEALIGLRRFSEAIDASNQAIRLTDGKFSFTHFHLGWSYLELQEWQFARQSFEKAAELEPTDTSARPTTSHSA